jgi:hypothetical protein
MPHSGIVKCRTRRRAAPRPQCRAAAPPAPLEVSRSIPPVTLMFMPSDAQIQDRALFYPIPSVNPVVVPTKDRGRDQTVFSPIPSVNLMVMPNEAPVRCFPQCLPGHRWSCQPRHRSALNPHFLRSLLGPRWSCLPMPQSGIYPPFQCRPRRHTHYDTRGASSID